MQTSNRNEETDTDQPDLRLYLQLSIISTIFSTFVTGPMLSIKNAKSHFEKTNNRSEEIDADPCSTRLNLKLDFLLYLQMLTVKMIWRLQ